MRKRLTIILFLLIVTGAILYLTLLEGKLYAPTRKHHDYSNLTSYYSYEFLDRAYESLCSLLDDPEFIKENQLDFLVSDSDFNKESVNSLSGFIMAHQFHLKALEYTSLSQIIHQKQTSLSVIRMDDDHLPSITYYKQWYTDQMIPCIIYTYRIGNDRTDFWFCLDINQNWILLKV